MPHSGSEEGTQGGFGDVRSCRYPGLFWNDWIELMLCWSEVKISAGDFFAMSSGMSTGGNSDVIFAETQFGPSMSFCYQI